MSTMQGWRVAKKGQIDEMVSQPPSQIYFGTIDGYRVLRGGKCPLWHVQYDDEDGEEWDEQEVKVGRSLYTSQNKNDPKEKKNNPIGWRVARVEKGDYESNTMYYGTVVQEDESDDELWDDEKLVFKVIMDDKDTDSNEWWDIEAIKVGNNLANQLENICTNILHERVAVEVAIDDARNLRGGAGWGDIERAHTEVRFGTVVKDLGNKNWLVEYDEDDHGGQQKLNEPEVKEAIRFFQSVKQLFQGGRKEHADYKSMQYW
jgi:hypothetical protein